MNVNNDVNDFIKIVYSYHSEPKWSRIGISDKLLTIWVNWLKCDSWSIYKRIQRGVMTYQRGLSPGLGSEVEVVELDLPRHVLQLLLAPVPPETMATRM